MRRIASALATKRSDNPPNDGNPPPTSSSPPSTEPRKKSSRRFFGTLTRITVSTARPTLPSEPAHSSSASSAGSVSLRTPEDDRVGHEPPHVGRSPSSRKAWISWLTPKKSDLHSQTQRPSSFWSDSLLTVPSPTTLPVPSTIIPGQPTESDDDTSSEESSSSESEAPPAPHKSYPLNRPLPPVGFLKTLTMNNYPPPFSPPPLLHYSNAPVFPRSSNGSRSLPFRATMESTMHRNRLLHRLQQGHFTPADQRLLATFGPHAPSTAQRRALMQPEEGERYDIKHVRSSSLGLKQWIARPYFEERAVVWVPNDAGTVVWTTVKGSGFGVWALEVSEIVELMAGLTDVEDVLPIGTLAVLLSPDSSPAHASLTAVAKHAPYKPEPSPLRFDRRTSDPPTSSSSEAMTPALVSTAVSASRRGVRFAENVDKEDQVPLDYVLRHRKGREEKTLFLQRERQRREHEEERLRHEAERQQWDQEKRQWQKEKRTLEEAKRQKQFAEEIAAARVRRGTLHALPSSQAREQDRKPREAYSRPSYDSRRLIESSSQPRPLRSRHDSSSSSKQGSLPQSESAGPLASRPVSMTSIASSEDVRTRVSRNSRQGSMISESSQRSAPFPVITYGWPPAPPLPQMLPIPSFSSVRAMPIMPQFPMDMPLLPPTAPFMRQQYERPRSPQSRGIGQSRSVERPPHSTDRASPPSRHRRSSSDDYGGRKSPPYSQTQTNNSLAPPRPAYPVHASTPSTFHRTSTTSSVHRKPSAARRQTAI